MQLIKSRSTKVIAFHVNRPTLFSIWRPHVNWEKNNNYIRYVPMSLARFNAPFAIWISYWLAAECYEISYGVVFLVVCRFRDVSDRIKVFTVWFLMNFLKTNMLSCLKRISLPITSLWRINTMWHHKFHAWCRKVILTTTEFPWESPEGSFAGYMFEISIPKFHT